MKSTTDSKRFMPLHCYTSLSVAAVVSLCLAIPSGYSYASALMILVSIPILLYKRPSLSLSRSDWLLIGTLIFYCVVATASGLYHQLPGSSFEKPSRFLLVIPTIVFLLAYPPRARYWWGALTIGTLAGCVLAVWQVLVEDRSRATGFMNSIQFGNLSLLMGGLSLAGIGWASKQRRKMHWCVALCVAGAAGLVASLLSGSRGGWLAIPAILVILYVAYRRYLPRRTMASALAVLAASLVIFYLVPQTGVQARIEHAVVDYQDYLSGENKSTSVGMRLEMWGAGLALAGQKPLLGWGESAYGKTLTELVEDERAGEMIYHYEHVHSDLLDVYLRAGLIGLLALVLVFAVPFALFTRAFTRGGAGDPYAVAGMILVVSIVIFGLTQAFFRHNSGVTVYLFYLAVLWSALRAADQPLESACASGAESQPIDS